MTATIKAHNLLPNRAAAQGTVVVTVNTEKQVIRDPAGNVVFQGPLTIKLVDGQAEVELPASDDATLEPSGFTFTATEQLSHVSKSNYRRVDFQTVDGETRFLADFAGEDEVALDPSYGASLNGALGQIEGLRDGTDPVFAAALSASTVAKPTLDLGDWSLLRRDTSDVTKGVKWTTTSAIVARALGWTIAADYAAFVGDGITDETAAVQAAVNAVPNGGDLFFPPGLTIRCAGVTWDGKGFRGRSAGTTFLQASDAAVMRARGGFETTISGGTASEEVRTVKGQSRRQGKYVLAGGDTAGAAVAAGYKPGDVVRLFSDDVIPEARPGTSGNESRQGEFAIVWEVSGSTIYFAGALSETTAGRYATNPRLARLKPLTMEWYGWRSMTPDTGLTSWTRQQLAIEAYISPRIESPDFPQGGAQALGFTGCFGYSVTDLRIGYLTDSSGTSQFGYGINDNSCENGSVDGGNIRNVRHAFTDDTQRIAAGSTDPALYGRPRFATLNGVHATGCSDSAFDTHSTGEGHQLTGCVARQSGNGFSFRGKGHRAVGCIARGNATNYRIADEGAGDASYGHELVNCVGVDARLDSVVVQNTTRVAGRRALRIVGGRFGSDTRAMRMVKADVEACGNAEFFKELTGVSSQQQIKVSDCTLTVDGATIDMSTVATGSTMSFINTDDATAVVAGKRLTCKKGSITMATAFSGVGAYTLREVDLNYTPTNVVATTATGSRVAYFNPATPAGAVVTA